MSFLYNTGARSHEAAEARISWFDFPNQLVTIRGKGRKDRVVPLWDSTVRVIQSYIKDHRRPPRLPGQDFLFINQRGDPMTRFGIRQVVVKYVKKARNRCQSLKSKRLTTHSLRHTTAMHLLESGVEINVIKAWLGHSDLSSTSRYLDADLSYKKQALSKFGPPIYVASALDKKNKSSTDQILDWLNNI